MTSVMCSRLVLSLRHHAFKNNEHNINRGGGYSNSKGGSGTGSLPHSQGGGGSGGESRGVYRSDPGELEKNFEASGNPGLHDLHSNHTHTEIALDSLTGGSGDITSYRKGDEESLSEESAVHTLRGVYVITESRTTVDSRTPR